jgi:hypothetical protein
MIKPTFPGYRSLAATFHPWGVRGNEIRSPPTRTILGTAAKDRKGHGPPSVFKARNGRSAWSSSAALSALPEPAPQALSLSRSDPAARHRGRWHFGAPSWVASFSNRMVRSSPRSVPPVDQCPTEIFRSCRALSRRLAALSYTAAIAGARKASGSAPFSRRIPRCKNSVEPMSQTGWESRIRTLRRADNPIPNRQLAS